eukprot:TRINITY_DN29101_c0_g1_i1.p1 TRINITY_DN29101_c0_g1~~TRINITY_DN29101_c0_g1_i1.p1  ORF type:complete len:331 (+),score=87.21 TRINITY_DN29101_c0_g1_i1:60-995(+)
MCHQRSLADAELVCLLAAQLRGTRGRLRAAERRAAAQRAEVVSQREIAERATAEAWRATAEAQALREELAATRAREALHEALRNGMHLRVALPSAPQSGAEEDLGSPLGSAACCAESEPHNEALAALRAKNDELEFDLMHAEFESIRLTKELARLQEELCRLQQEPAPALQAASAHPPPAEETAGPAKGTWQSAGERSGSRIPRSRPPPPKVFRSPPPPPRSPVAVESLPLREDEDVKQDPAEALRRRLDAWLCTVPIGGNPDSTSERYYEAEPFVGFALSHQLMDWEPERIYDAYVAWKLKVGAAAVAEC